MGGFFGQASPDTVLLAALAEGEVVEARAYHERNEGERDVGVGPERPERVRLSVIDEGVLAEGVFDHDGGVRLVGLHVGEFAAEHAGAGLGAEAFVEIQVVGQGVAGGIGNDGGHIHESALAALAHEVFEQEPRLAVFVFDDVLEHLFVEPQAALLFVGQALHEPVRIPQRNGHHQDDDHREQVQRAEPKRGAHGGKIGNAGQ